MPSNKLVLVDMGQKVYSSHTKSINYFVSVAESSTQGGGVRENAYGACLHVPYVMLPQ